MKRRGFSVACSAILAAGLTLGLFSLLALHYGLLETPRPFSSQPSATPSFPVRLVSLPPGIKAPPPIKHAHPNNPPAQIPPATPTPVTSLPLAKHRVSSQNELTNHPLNPNPNPQPTHVTATTNTTTSLTSLEGSNAATAAPLLDSTALAQEIVILEKAQPIYPEMARKAGQECQLLVEIIVDEKGYVSAAKIQQSNQNGYGFPESALAAVAKMRFQPIRLHAQPIRCRLVIPIEFILIQDPI